MLHRFCRALGGLFLLSALATGAWGQEAPPVPSALPAPGAKGAFKGPNSDISGLNTGASAKTAAEALSGYRPGETVRGGAEGAIYRKAAPSVVLIMTDKGLGSGSIISMNGEILTSNHVVEGFTTVNVLLKPLKDGDKPAAVYIADVTKVDTKADLALVKLREMPPGRAPIPLGDFNKVSVGDDVSAIGHPMGDTWTFTKGYVSQIRKDYDWKENAKGPTLHADLIQTQTPINPGNSGGPLLNAQGELIGVNTFVTNEAEGLNFAVAVDTVQAFLKAPPSPPQIVAQAPAGTPSQSGPAADGQCKPQLMFEGRNDKNNASVRRYDISCRGRADLAFILPDDTSQPLIAVVDSKGTGKPDGEIISYHRDGHWDISYWDTKGTGHWDTIGYHPDGKIKPSSYGPYVPKQ